MIPVVMSVAAVFGWIGAGAQLRRVVAGTNPLVSPLLPVLMVLGVTITAVGTLLEAGSQVLGLVALLPLALVASFEGGVSWSRSHSAPESDQAGVAGPSE